MVQRVGKACPLVPGLPPAALWTRLQETCTKVQPEQNGRGGGGGRGADIKQLSWSRLRIKKSQPVHSVWSQELISISHKETREVQISCESIPRAKIKPIRRPANEKTLNALLSRAGFEKLSREMWLMFSTNSEKDVPGDLGRERKRGRESKRKSVALFKVEKFSNRLTLNWGVHCQERRPSH